MRFERTAGGLTSRVSCTPGLELRGPFPGPSSSGVSFASWPSYFLRNVTAGMLDGDCYEIDVRVGRGVAVRVSPTSATRVFVAREHGATMRVRIEVEPGGLLDYDAGLTIPHVGAIGEQITEIVVHPGARLAYSDSLSFGRIASGERFAFTRLTSDLRVHTPEGRVLLSRRSVLEPPTHRVLLEAACGGANALGSLLLIGSGEGATPEQTLDTHAGVSQLPHDLGAQAQVLAARAEQIPPILAPLRLKWLALPGGAS